MIELEGVLSSWLGNHSAPFRPESVGGFGCLMGVEEAL